MTLEEVFDQPMPLLLYLLSLFNDGLMGWIFRLALCNDLDGDIDFTI